MKTKSALTFVLLGFVAVSAAAMVWKEVRTAPEAPMDTRGVADRSASGSKLIAYYFHGKVRCVTCNDIERTAREAIESGFGPELASGRIAWRVVNYEEPGNEHYATDYRLAAPCVVLVSMRDGRQESWTSLPEVWELVGDEAAFTRFVQARVAEQLGESATGPPEIGCDVSSTPAPSAERVASLDAPARPKLLDLGAGRCIPCKMMAPILDDLRKEYDGRFDVVFLDVWENPNAAETHGVTTIPTQIFLDAEGTERFRHEGFFSKEEILATWERLGVDVDQRSRSE
jgi:thioredoxin 1